MIYVNADLHGDFSTLYAFAESEDGKKLGKKDFVIILGDFGIDQSNLESVKLLDRDLPFTLMFLDGNHEDFPLLESMDKKELFGGLVHDINGVYHMCRGEVFVLPCDDKSITVAVCGGGNTRDREKRVFGQSWFPEEEITDRDVNNLKKNLEKFDFKVDYFLSHVMSSAVKLECFTKSFSVFGEGIESMIPMSCEYRVRDMVGFTNAREYLCGHEHVLMEYQLFGKKYTIIYAEYRKLT